MEIFFRFGLKFLFSYCGFRYNHELTPREIRTQLTCIHFNLWSVSIVR
jgi:hypothetical protein